MSLVDNKINQLTTLGFTPKEAQTLLDGKAVVTGKFAPMANLRPEVRRALAFLERQPSPQVASGFFKSILSQVDGPFKKPANAANVQGGLMANLLSDDAVAALGKIPRPAAKALDKARQTLAKFTLSIADFNAKTMHQKLGFVDSYLKNIDSVLKDIGKSTAKSPGLREYRDNLVELKSQVAAMRAAVISNKTADYDQLQTAKNPALRDVKTALDAFWTAQAKAMDLHGASRKYAGLSLNQRTQVLEQLQKALLELVGNLDSALARSSLKDDLAVLQALKDAANAKLAAVAGAVHDELRSRTGEDQRLGVIFAKVEQPAAKAVADSEKVLDTLDREYDDDQNRLDATEKDRLAALQQFKKLNTVQRTGQRQIVMPAALKKILADRGVSLNNRVACRNGLAALLREYDVKIAGLRDKLAHNDGVWKKEGLKLAGLKDVLAKIGEAKKFFTEKSRVPTNKGGGDKIDGKVMDAVDELGNAAKVRKLMAQIGLASRKIPHMPEIDSLLDALDDVATRFESNAEDRDWRPGLDEMLKWRGKAVGLDQIMETYRAGLYISDVSGFKEGMDDAFEVPGGQKKPSNIDPGLIPPDQRGRKILGQGGFNAALLVNWKTPDGKTETRVLKDEENGRGSLVRTLASAYSGIGKTPGAAVRNLVSAKLAESLAMPDILPKPDIVMSRGKLSLAMPVAPGQSMGKLQPTLIKESIAVKCRLARELCKLEWLDALTGQVDRHQENYHVLVDNGKVTVTAIDNDLAFGTVAQKPGEGLADDRDPGLGTVDTTRYVKTGGVKSKDDYRMDRNGDLYYSPKFYRAGSASHQRGFHAVGFPALIDRTTYDALVGPKATLASFLGDNADYLDDDQYNALESRFAALQAHARALAKAGLVVDAWETWKVPADMTSTPGSIARGVPPSVKLSVSQGMNVLGFLATCGSFSYLRRDVYEDTP